MNKASAGNGISAYLFQVLKIDAVKVLHSICQQIWKTQQWPQDWKTSFFIPILKKGNVKECSNYNTIALISHPRKSCSEFSKPGFNNVWTKNLQTYKLDLDEAEKPEIKVPTPVGSLKKQENSRKISISASLTISNSLTVWITANSGKFLKRWDIRTPYLPPESSVCRSRSNIYNWTWTTCWIQIGKRERQGFSSVWFSHSVMSDSVTPWTAACQVSLSIANSPSLPSVMLSNHLVLCYPLLFPPSIFPSIRVFSNASVLHIRWPKYWSFSFNISSSNAYSGLIPLGLTGWISL